MSDEKKQIASVMDSFPNKPQEDTIEEYLLYGQPMGSFWEAVFSNELVRSIGQADIVNQFLIKEICDWLYWQVPVAAWGSSEKYLEWVKQGGLVGKTTDD